MLSPLLPPIHHLHFKNHQNVPRTDVPRTAFGVVEDRLGHTGLPSDEQS